MRDRHDFLALHKFAALQLPRQARAFQGMRKQSARRSGAFLHFAAVELGRVEKD
jgi:hypothetical protein